MQKQSCKKKRIGQTQAGEGQQGRASPGMGNEPEVLKDSSKPRKTNETGARHVRHQAKRGAKAA